VFQDIFFPTYSYIFFQRKIFQIRLQDYRFFIPPAYLIEATQTPMIVFKTFTIFMNIAASLNLMNWLHLCVGNWHISQSLEETAGLTTLANKFNRLHF
jgi:hypothetical protein